MNQEKPDPQQILRSLKKEESRQGGLLRIFFGMSAGVGKTYAMLQAAHKTLQSGKNIIIGAIDTHGRPETEALMLGLPVIPLRKIEYKGTLLEELDLDAVLEQKPEIVLIDELAHTNAPTSRHKKRWQDVFEILDAGISVWTAINVQHIESRKDSVEEITGVRIRETVPDSVFDRASEIELVDITPSSLLLRLQEGKVYLGGERVAAAIENFFKEDHLTALREIALRYTAKKVDHDLQDLIAAKTHLSSWKTAERLLVAVSHSPYSERLIRTTRRLADNINAEWISVYIDDGKPLSSEDRNTLAKNLALAQSLGSEIVNLADPDIANSIERVARQRNVTQIIIGRPTKRWLRDRIQGGTLLDSLVQKVGDLDVYVIRHERPPKKVPHLRTQLQLEGAAQDYINALGWLTGISALGYAFLPLIGYRAVGFFFLLLVLLRGLKTPLGPVLFLALLSSLIWDFFFIPPFGTFFIQATEDIAMCLVFFVAASVTGVLVHRAKKRQSILEIQEKKSQLLFEVAKVLVESRESQAPFEKIEHFIRQYLPGKIAIAGVDAQGDLQAEYFDSEWWQPENNEWDVAKWVFRNGQKAGITTETFSSSRGFYIPLSTRQATVGVMGFLPEKETYLGVDQKNFLFGVAHQIAIYLERGILLEKSKNLLLLEESEKLHQTILNSVSHEIRIPLAAIIGFSSTLEDQVGQADGELLRSLTREIQSSAQRLNHVVENLLDMSRLSQGKLQLNKEWYGLEEVIDKSIEYIRQQFSGISIEKVLNDDNELLAQIDFSLIETVTNNLLYNAIQYGLPNVPVVVHLGKTADRIVVSVENKGKKLLEGDLERVFDKFYRVSGTPSGGAGLGLAICKAIVSAHQGCIWAENTAEGVRVSFSLPLDENEPAEEKA